MTIALVTKTDQTNLRGKITCKKNFLITKTEQKDQIQLKIELVNRKINSKTLFTESETKKWKNIKQNLRDMKVK